MFDMLPVGNTRRVHLADMAGDESSRVSAVLGINMLTDFAVALDVPAGTLDLANFLPRVDPTYKPGVVELRDWADSDFAKRKDKWKSTSCAVHKADGIKRTGLTKASTRRKTRSHLNNL